MILLFLTAEKDKSNVFLSCPATLTEGKAGSPALRSRLFRADYLSAPDYLSPVLLQALQGLSLSIYFT